MYTINTVENLGAEKLRQNYSQINEMGKEKMKEVAEKILDIWEITYVSKKENQHGNKRYS